MEALLASNGIPNDTISLLLHAGCINLEDLQHLDDALLDELNIHQVFIRKKLLRLKFEQVPASAKLQELASLLAQVNILPEKCEKYALLLSKEGFDSPPKLSGLTEEDLAAMGISSLYDVRLIMGLTRSSEAVRANGRRLSVLAQPTVTVNDKSLVLVRKEEVETPSPSPFAAPVLSEEDYAHILPHETESMVLQIPRTEGPDSHDELAIISLNLLADCNLQRSKQNAATDMRYRHMSMEQCDWEVRFRGLRRLFLLHINEGNVDVFCFQEADYDRFHSHLAPFFARQGFTAWHQWDGAKGGEIRNEFGVAIAFRKSKFRETFRESRSRTMLLGLATPSTEWFIVNCHLEADPEKTDKRLAQLSSTLFNLSVHAKLNPRTARVIVVGDFNSGREPGTAFQWLLNCSNDNGDGERKTFAPHAFRFQDAYINAGPDAQLAPTYADPFIKNRVDHCLFTMDTCLVLEALRIPRLDPETTGKFGIFYDTYPTDHYPVGCLLQALQPPPPPPLANTQEEGESAELTPGRCAC